MPRKQSPIHTVIDYFENAPIDAVKLALDVVAAIVKRRAPKTAEPKKATKKKAGPGPAPTTVGE